MSVEVQDVIKTFEVVTIVTGVKDMRFKKAGQRNEHSFFPQVITSKWVAPATGPQVVKVSGPRKNNDGSAGKITHYIEFGLGGVRGYPSAPAWLLSVLVEAGIMLPSE